MKSSRFQVSVCAVLLASAAVAADAADHAALATPIAASAAEKNVEREIRSRLKEFEDAWNRGDAGPIVSQYHSSYFSMEYGQFNDRASYLKMITAKVADPDRVRLRIEISHVRPMGHDYALVDGFVYGKPKQGDETHTYFSLIYMRSVGQWMFIYGHI